MASSSTPKLLNCGQCDFSTCSPTFLKEHQKFHEERSPYYRNYDCDRCDFHTTKARSFLCHEVGEHFATYSVFACEMCHYAAKNIFKLNRHKTLIHKDSLVPINTKTPCLTAEEIRAECDKRLAHAFDMKYFYVAPAITSSVAAENSNNSEHFTAGSTLDFSGTFNCPVCKYSTSTQLDMKKHMLSHSTDATTSAYPIVKEEAFSDDEGNLVIDEPETDIADQPTATLGQKQQSADKKCVAQRHFKCSQCNFRNPSRQTIRVHENSVHGRRVIFRCTHCEFTTGNKSTFYNHRLKHTEEPLTCDFCDFVTVYKWNLERHVKTHPTVIELPCEKCEFISANKSLLRLHKAEKHEPSDGAHGKSSVRVTGADMITEVEVASQESSTVSQASQRSFICLYRCPMCSYETNTVVYLHCHMNTHPLDQPFVCQHCQSSFNNQYKYVKHLTSDHFEQHIVDNIAYNIRKEACVTSDDKLPAIRADGTFNCPTCRYSTSTQLDIKKHLLSHSTDILYRCVACTFDCKFYSDYVRHVKSYHTKYVRTEPIMPMKKRNPVLPEENLSRSNPEPSKKEVDGESVLTMSGNGSSANALPDNSAMIRPNLICSECNYAAKWPSEMMKHKRVHTGETPYACTVCGYETKWTGDLTRHMTKYHPGVPFDDIIALKVEDAVTAKGVKRTLPPDIPCTSNGDNQSTSSRASTNSDSSSNTNVRTMAHSMSLSSPSARSRWVTYKCPLCSYTADVPSKIKQHVVSHSVHYPFSCSICKTKSHWRSDITKHIKTKEGHDNATVIYDLAKREEFPEPIEVPLPYGEKTTEEPRKIKKKKTAEDETSTEEGRDHHRFQCTECNYASQWRAAVRRHIRVKRITSKTHHEATIDDACKSSVITEQRQSLQVEKLRAGLSSGANVGYATMVPLRDAHLGGEKAKPASGTSQDSNKQPDDKMEMLPSNTEKQPFAKSPFNDRPWQCSECGYRSNYKWDVTKHIKLKATRWNNHTDAKVQSIIPGDEKKAPTHHRYDKTDVANLPHRCSDCSFSANRRCDVHKHITQRNARNGTHKGAQPLLDKRFLKDRRPVALSPAGNIESTNETVYVWKFKCPCCDFVQGKAKEVADHIEAEHKGTDTVQRDRGDLPFSCLACSYVSLFKNTMVSHITHMHDGNMECLVDDTISTNLSKRPVAVKVPDFSEAVKEEVEPQSGNLTNGTDVDAAVATEANSVDNCSENFIYSHSRLKNGKMGIVVYYTCDQCPYKTRSKNCLLYHKQFHRPLKNAPFKCKLCTYHAKLPHLISQHMHVHDVSETCGQNANEDDQDQTSEASTTFTTEPQHEIVDGKDVLVMYQVNKGVRSKLYKCQHSNCGHTGKRLSHVLLHQQLHIRKDDFNLMRHCPLCTYKCFKQNYSFICNHLERDHGLDAEKAKAYSLGQIDENDFTEISGKEGDTISAMSPDCNEQVAKIPYGLDHIHAGTALKRPRSCRLEEEEYQSIELWQIECLLEWQELQKQLLTNGDMSQIEIESPRLLYRCDRCPYASYQKDAALSHLQMHDNGQLARCSFCDYSASADPYLKEHTICHFRPILNMGVLAGCTSEDSIDIKEEKCRYVAVMQDCQSELEKGTQLCFVRHDIEYNAEMEFDNSKKIQSAQHKKLTGRISLSPPIHSVKEMNAHVQTMYNQLVHQRLQLKSRLECKVVKHETKVCLDSILEKVVDAIDNREECVESVLDNVQVKVEQSFSLTYACKLCSRNFKSTSAQRCHERQHNFALVKKLL